MSVEARTIEALLREGRTFPPSEEFRARARVTDDSLHREADADVEAFWRRQAEKYVSCRLPAGSVAAP
jgi:acetyl-CoA synthetase